MSFSLQIDDLTAGLGSVLDEHLAPVSYYPGSVIFHEGEVGDCAYLIEQGQVQITKRIQGEEQVVASLGAGEFIGEMAAVDNQLRSASATVTEHTELIVITREQLEKRMQKSDPLLGLLIRVLLNRLRLKDQVSDGLSSSPSAQTECEMPEIDDAFEQARSRAVGRIKLERALRDAVKRQEFEVRYQPIVSVSDGGVAGFEALIRWHRPGCGMVSPVEFIELAEQTGLIVPIGAWVLEQACHALTRFQSLQDQSITDRPPLFMSVNVSPRQLLRFANVENMLATIQMSGLEPARLKLEITEQVMVDDPKAAGAAFRRFKEFGVKLAIDDFGTGYSSLSYLHRFPLDTLKIDRAFISSMLSDRASQQIVGTITRLAHDLGMDIVAEGVECEEELAVLDNLGCRYAQGYLFSKPVAYDKAVEFLDAQTRPAPGTTSIEDIDVQTTCL